MENLKEASHDVAGRQLIVKADEVDQVGTAIQSPNEQLPPSALEERDGMVSATRRTSATQSKRPTLRRDGSAPFPPSQPPPPSPPPAPPIQQSPDTATDSLSLSQLKQLVSRFPKAEQRAYAFQYADAQSFAEEIEEWFQYSEQDRSMILSAKHTFEQNWRSFSHAHRGLPQDDLAWTDVGDSLRKNFLMSVVSTLEQSDRVSRIQSLEVVFYILGGSWGTTAGLGKNDALGNQPGSETAGQHRNSVQIEWMHKGADLLLECSCLQRLLDCMVKIFDGGDVDGGYGDDASHDDDEEGEEAEEAEEAEIDYDNAEDDNYNKGMLVLPSAILSHHELTVH